MKITTEEKARLELLANGVHSMGEVSFLARVLLKLLPVAAEPKPCPYCYGSGLDENREPFCSFCKGSGTEALNS